MSHLKGSSLGIPIVMPREGSSFRRKRSEADLNFPPSVTTSPRPPPKALSSSKGPHAQIVLLKRKRNEEPLDGLRMSFLVHLSSPPVAHVHQPELEIVTDDVFQFI